MNYPFENDTSAVIKKLAKNFFRNNNQRNLIAICATALTTILFVVLLSVTYGMNFANEQLSFQQAGTDASIGFRFISDEIYHQISSNSRVQDSGYRKFVTDNILNSELQSTPIEMSYMDEYYMVHSFSNPTVGNMPEKENEIVCDSRILDSLGIPHEIGSIIPLNYSIRGKTYSTEFVLSGFYEANSYESVQMILVSDLFVTEYIDALENTYEKDGELSGVVMMYVDTGSKQSSQIQSDLYSIVDDLGFSLEEGMPNYINGWVNPAYSVDHSMGLLGVMGILLAVLFFILVGYLIIYNIFYISLINDVHFYGILRTIGTTSKQVNKIIKSQSLWICLYGISIGLVLGTGISFVAFDIISETTVLSNNRLHLNIGILCVSALFSTITVFLGIGKSAKTVSKLSPIDSARFLEKRTIPQKHIKSINKDRGFSLAISHFCMSGKKVLLVVLSLSSSLILLNCVTSITSGMDEGKYIKQHIKSDFVIGNTAVFDGESTLDEIADIPNELIQALESTEIFVEGGRTYVDTSQITFEVPEHSRTESDQKQYVTAFGGVTYELGENNDLSCFLYGMDEYTLSNLTLTNEEKNHEILEKMQSGKYILVDESGLDMIKPGDRITLFSNGATYTFEVLEFIVPDSQDISENCGITTTGISFYLPAETFMKCSQNYRIMSYSFNVLSDALNDVEIAIDEYMSSVGSDYEYQSKTIYHQRFEQQKQMWQSVGIFVSFVIGVIGILNFINTIITDIIARRKEICLLRCVGMTIKQVKKMLVLESLCYTIMTIVVTLFSSITLVPFICNGITKVIGMQYFSYHYNLTILFIIYMILILLSLIIPLKGYKSLLKEKLTGGGRL